ncbi:GspE/PulE family protein [Nocardioides marinus]|uniref:Type IV pilus assembly protein PilB n=1 Tax=Nocardioides marinus TaxID=374514 RepID=A0A7Y9YFW1_9ACTN|nr:GspE/PulE family protein [uncultured Nocardioides sp.]NYI11428.1 type IV pilus assembly protein PilB [Nocardioides marinus]
MDTASLTRPDGRPEGRRGPVVEELLAQGKVTPAQVEEARALAGPGGEVLPALVRMGVVDRAELLRWGAEASGVDFLELTDLPLDAAATALLPGDFARRAGIIPVGWRDGELVVAAPVRLVLDLSLKDDVARLTGQRVRFALARSAEIQQRLNQTYRAEGELADLSIDLSHDVEDTDDDLDTFTEVAEDAPVVRFVNLLITQAIADKASDIHLEPTEKDLRVRYRIDGVLRDAHRAPRSILGGVVSRLKIMADMDIAERRIPQDGRLSVSHLGQTIDLRVATLPTVWGEKVVARVLDNSNTRLGLADLGFSPGNFTRFEASYTKPYGMILVTGPTGSGKSTTLYATLNILNQQHVNVITVEDPVEYRLPGINQVQTNPKAGLTFASALRSILRSDPDIVLIGEIRDHETANIAVEAALTGHLVLSTLHTNDAPSAVTRLVEMGIEPFLVGSALDCVVAQRLCRSLCERCKEAYVPGAEALALVGFPVEPGEADDLVLHRPKGCSTCGGTGYRGRMALHEVMPIDEQLEKLTVRRSSADEITRAAREGGMGSLREDGWLKVRHGRTSIEEVLRVVG